MTIPSTSTNNVLSDSSSKLTPCVFMRDESMFLAGWICLSHTPPMWLANGGFFFHWIQSALFCNMNSPTFFWLTSFQHLASSLFAPTKLLPLSHRVVLILPRLSINLLSANIKDSVSICLIISIWMARLAKHVKRAPYRFNVFLLSLMRNGPNMSTPQWVNWGYSFNLSCGRSAIICSPTFPRSLLLVKHLEIIFYTAELLCITQNLEDLISLRVMFLQLCAIFWWHYLINSAVTFPLFGRMIGWVTLLSRVSFFSLPQTLKIP